MLYQVARRVIGPPLKKYFSLTCEGADHLPKTGPAIVVCNHLNYLDPFIMGAVFDRPLHFMAKAELFEKRWLAWLLRKAYAFPVRRGRSDRQAIRHALNVLKEGHVVALFPEGTRSKTGELLELQRGAALLALHSGAPIIPMVILGGYEALAGGRKFPRRVPIRVRVGEPLTFASETVDSATITEVSRRIEETLLALLNKSGEGGRTRAGADNAWAGRKGYPAEGKASK
ncbi:MAG: lysophospholipid acyltransferase family protein [Bacillota bacterium]